MRRQNLTRVRCKAGGIYHGNAAIAGRCQDCRAWRAHREATAHAQGTTFDEIRRRRATIIWIAYATFSLIMLCAVGPAALCLLLPIGLVAYILFRRLA